MDSEDFPEDMDLLDRFHNYEKMKATVERMRNENPAIDSVPPPVPARPAAKPLDASIVARNEAYANLTIGEALSLLESRRGENKKEKAKLMKLLELPGVTKKTSIADARAKRG